MRGCTAGCTGGRDAVTGDACSSRVLLAAVPLLLGGGAALAADDAPVLEAITVVGKRPEPLSQVAASVTVLTAADIESQLAGDLRDLFGYQPAVTVGADPHRFGLSGINIRGLGGNRVLLETDGVPAPSTFAIGSYSDTGRPFADLELIERVEVLHGPASSLYGSDALAGVVATTTVDPADLLGADGTPSRRLRTAYSAVDDGTLLGATGAARFGQAEVLLAAGHREAHETDINSATAVPNPRDARRDMLLARVVHRGLARPLRLTVGWDRLRARTDVDSLELSPGRFANTTALVGDDHEELTRVVLDQPAAPWGSLEQAEWRVYWQSAEVEQDTSEQRRAAPPRSPALDIAREFRYREDMAGGELTLAHSFDAAGARHRLVGGVEVNRSRVAESRDGLQTNLETGEVTSVILGESLPVRDFPHSTITRAGVYAQDDFRPGDGALSLIPAVRLDWYRLEPRVDALYAEDNPSQVPVSIDQLALSPKLGVAWRVTAASTLFLQYAHGFRAPPFEDVNIGLDLPQFNLRALPNPDLEPERSDSIETGLRVAGPSLAGSVSAYYSRYRDFIESKVNLGRDPATGTLLFQSRNLARATIWGAEAAFDVDLGGLAGAPDGWAARIAAAYARGDDTERRVPLNSIEPLRTVLGTRYEDPAGRFGVELAATWVAPKCRVAEEDVPLFRTPGFWTLDVMGNWQLGRVLRLNAGVFNLTDRSYFEWTDVRGLAADDPLLEQYRRPGRHWSVSLTARF